MDPMTSGAPAPETGSDRLANPRQAAVLAGVLGGVAYLAVAAIVRGPLGVLTLPEITQGGLLQLIPGQLFSALLDVLAAGAKPLLFGALLIAVLLVGGLLGWMFALTRSRTILEAGLLRAGAEGLAVGLAAFLFLGAVWIPGLGGGFFATRAGSVEVGNALLSQLLPCLAFGLTLGLLAPVLARGGAVRPASAGPHGLSRRGFLLASVATVAAVGAGGFLWLQRAGAASGSAARTGLARLSSYVTPNHRFYTISKNFFDPIVKADTWRLQVAGGVERPFTLTLDEIRALPATEDYNTLMCVSNEVGGHLIGNALWKGTSLRGLLDRAGVLPGAVDVKFTCADDYTDSIPIEKALEPDVRLVYEMNGEPLPDSHGFPVRLVVPGIYGMKNVKWVRRIEVVPIDYKGFWAQQGWDDRAPYQLFSRWDVPGVLETLPLGTLPVGGVAFSGDRGISRVEVSFDGGQTWSEAIVEPPRGAYTWVRWTAEWRPEAAGRYQIVVRAYDGQGNRQVASRTPPFPSGATGYHTITVTVRA